VARPYKNNLDSVILDLSFDQQKETKYIEARHGLTGFAVVAKLLIYILRQGYYITWTEEVQTDFLIYTNTDKVLIESIIACAIDTGLFDAELYEDHKVLTSKKLQELFFKACERRKAVHICTKYALIDISKYNNIIIVNNNSVSVSINRVIACKNIVNVDNNPINDNNYIVNVSSNPINDNNNVVNVDNNPINDNNNIVNADNNIVNVNNNQINADNNLDSTTGKVSSMFDDLFENQ
jgi:hypothetical protein